MAAGKHSAAKHSAAKQGGQDSQGVGDAAGMKPDIRPVETLLEHGVRMRLTSPEVALVFGERAVALAEAGGSEKLWVRAEALAVFAHIRLGRRAAVVDRAMAALRAAEAGGYADLGAELRTDIALCARSVGVPLTGLAALRPVLATAEVRPALRAAALVQLVGCLSTVGRRGVLDQVLADAENLISGDRTLDADSRTLLQVMVCTRSTAHLRRHGDIAAAVASAQRGLDLLSGLGDHAADGAQFGPRLVCEMVCALLDSGAAEEAAELARPLLDRPLRAAAVAPLAWMRLAVATRILLPAGSAEAAGGLVREALYFAGRHGLRALSARLWLELSHIEERLGRPAEAVRCLREARAEEHRYSRVRGQATSLLTGEFGRGEQLVVDIPRLLDAAKIGAPSAAGAPRVQRAPARVEPVFADAPIPAPAPVLEQPPAPRAEKPTPAVDLPSAQEPDESAPNQSAADDGGARHADSAPSARAVLERLGVTVGSGGRRRARNADDPEEPADAATGQDTGKHTKPVTADWASEQVMLPRLTMPGTLAPPDALSLVTGVADTDTDTGKVNDTDAVEDLRPEEPPQRAPQPQEMDSLLAVFSNWTGDDYSEPTDISTRTRRRRSERTGPGMTPVDPSGANGRVVNGESGSRGSHQGEA
ncbi:MAG: hypothetical protein ACRDSE_08580 [Pseudonocardiaceae bacterium]